MVAPITLILIQLMWKRGWRLNGSGGVDQDTQEEEGKGEEKKEEDGVDEN